jgi:uncharacterized membrane protein (DUF2068 family)
VARTHRSDLLLRLIVFEKGLLGLLAFFLSAGLLSLVHRNLELFAMQLASVLNLDTDNRFLKLILTQLMDIKPPALVGVSVAGFLYSTLNFIEAIGLMMRYRWAEYLTVIATALFIPFELYEIFDRLTLFRLAALMINLLIVAFLVRHTEMFSKRGSQD